jgi:hypothetical protein
MRPCSNRSCVSQAGVSGSLVPHLLAGSLDSVFTSSDGLAFEPV